MDESNQIYSGAEFPPRSGPVCVFPRLSVSETPNSITCTVSPLNSLCIIILNRHPSLFQFQCFFYWISEEIVLKLNIAFVSVFLSVSFFLVSARAEATGPPADGGQVLSGEKWWVVQSYSMLSQDVKSSRNNLPRNNLSTAKSFF